MVRGRAGCALPTHTERFSSHAVRWAEHAALLQQAGASGRRRRHRAVRAPHDALRCVACATCGEHRSGGSSLAHRCTHPHTQARSSAARLWCPTHRPTRSRPCASGARPARRRRRKGRARVALTGRRAQRVGPRRRRHPNPVRGQLRQHPRAHRNGARQRSSRQCRSRSHCRRQGRSRSALRRCRCTTCGCRATTRATATTRGTTGRCRWRCCAAACASACSPSARRASYARSRSAAPSSRPAPRRRRRRRMRPWLRRCWREHQALRRRCWPCLRTMRTAAGRQPRRAQENPDARVCQSWCETLR